MKKLDARRLHPEAQQAIRLRIAAYLQSGKWTQRQAADIFQVSLAAVKKIWKQYKEGGTKALHNKKRGPAHSSSRLSKAQVKKVTRCIEKGTPDSYQLPYYLWTANAVRLLIKKKPVWTTGFAMFASCCTVGTLHHRNLPSRLMSKVPARCKDGWSSSILPSGGRLKGRRELSSGLMSQACVLSTMQELLMHPKVKHRWFQEQVSALA